MPGMRSILKRFSSKNRLGPSNGRDISNGEQILTEQLAFITPKQRLADIVNLEPCVVRDDEPRHDQFMQYFHGGSQPESELDRLAVENFGQRRESAWYQITPGDKKFEVLPRGETTKEAFNKRDIVYELTHAFMNFSIAGFQSPSKEVKGTSSVISRPFYLFGYNLDTNTTSVDVVSRGIHSHRGLVKNDLRVRQMAEDYLRNEGLTSQGLRHYL